MPSRTEERFRSGGSELQDGRGARGRRRTLRETPARYEVRRCGIQKKPADLRNRPRIRAGVSDLAEPEDRCRRHGERSGKSIYARFDNPAFVVGAVALARSGARLRFAAMEELEAWNSFQSAMESHGDPEDRQSHSKNGPHLGHGTSYLPQPAPEFKLQFTHRCDSKCGSAERPAS